MEKIRLWMQSLQQCLEREYWQWPLWIPVGLACGIIVYFKLPLEPTMHWLGAGLIASLLLPAGFYFLRYEVLSAISWFMVWMMLGMVVAKYRTDHVAAPVLKHEQKFVELGGTVEAVIPQAKGVRLLLNDIVTDRFRTQHTPAKIRLIVRTKILKEGQPHPIKIGDRVFVVAMLSPPPKASMPGSYDFSFVAYYQRIGAVGYSVSPVEIIGERTHHFYSNAIENLRLKWSARVVEALGPGRGHIASALMMGEYAAMDARLLDAMRASGLAHILSVSGMHLTLVATIFFVAIRMLLALSPRLTLHFPIKKIAAFIAILGSFGYLMISGLQVAAVRSFLMTLVVLVGILLDRQPHPMRAVAWAATLILLIEPENLFGASFQMSFAAVTALIALYPYWFGWWQRYVSPTSWFQRMVSYVAGIIASSLIAGSATAPFAMYHFGQYANYGMLANVLALPIATFWVMPLVVIAFLLLPFSLESLALFPMGYGIDAIIGIAKWVGSMPGASMMVPTMPIGVFGIIVFGGVWVLLWQERWRWWGGIMMLVGIMAVPFATSPSMLIDGKSSNFAVKSADGSWIFSSRRFSTFTRDIWLKSNAQTSANTLKDAMSGEVIQCDEKLCHYRLGNKEIVLIRQASCDAFAVPKDSLVIELKARPYECKNALLYHGGISHRMLSMMGSLALYWSHKKGLTIVPASPLHPVRPWQRDVIP